MQDKICNAPPALYSADTVSFTAMKKNEFKGIDLVVVNAFRAPVEKFNTNEDFQNWCNLKTDEIKNKNFGGRQPETIEQRKHLLKEWSDYVLDKDSVYTNSIALLILDGVTKNLKEDNDKLPPVLDRRVLADTIDEIYTRSADDKAQFNFNKIYQTKLMNFYLEDTNDINTGETKTGWVKIPSYNNDSENFESNVDRLKILSHPNWCTKSFNARPYLQNGDFHVYLENGKPKIGIRLVDDEIVEIQCEKNNGKIALAYIDEVQKYVDGNNFRLNEASAKEIETAAKAKIDSIKIKADLKDAIETNDAKAIYNYFGIETEENDDKTLTISFYRQPKNLTFEDLGIDENKIFENVKKIKHYADFRGSFLTNLGKLEYIGRDADFRYSNVTELGALKSIGRNIDIRYSNFTKKDFEGIATDKNKIIDNENTNPVLRMLKNVIDIFKPVTIRNRQEK